MSDLVARVTERLDELERVAEAATPGPWMVDDDNPDRVMKPDRPGNSWDGTYITAMQDDDFGLTDPHNATHIALNDPDQTKRLVAGLRAVVALHGSDDETFCNACTTAWPCPTLTALASIWEVGS